MKVNEAVRYLMIVLPMLILPAPGAAAKKVSSDGIVVFGDSLSDPGNKHALTGLANTPPYDLLDVFRIPEGPYTKGGLHHSNGATWVEQLARPLGFGGDVCPAYRSRGRATNCAYGGARARDPGEDPGEILDCVPPTTNKHSPEQVSDSLADVYSAPSSGALYVIFVGGNDVADAVRALACDSTGAMSVDIVRRSLEALGEEVLKLYGAGARRFLVVKSPDLGLTPAFNPPLNIPEASTAATFFSLLFIQGLVGVLDNLDDLVGIEITTYDVFSKLVQLVIAPMAGEPQNGEQTCVMPNIPPYKCQDHDDYVFWDGIHPTKAVHSILAEEIGAVLGD